MHMVTPKAAQKTPFIMAKGLGRDVIREQQQQDEFCNLISNGCVITL